MNTMRGAEQYSLNFSQWYMGRRPSPPPAGTPGQATMLTGDASSGTASGLSKMPYIRDTRRSVGVGGFRLNSTQLSSGDSFPDRVGIGDYLYFDVHANQGCPAMKFDGNLQPYQLPLRALTNDAVQNLVVAGKTMAQTNAANAATRLHPVEWVSGTAAGMLAVEMRGSAYRSGGGEGGAAPSTAKVVESCVRDPVALCPLQQKIRNLMPLDWKSCTSPGPAPSACSSACATCLKYGGGRGCLPKCKGCASGCTSCIQGGGGAACAGKCG